MVWIAVHLLIATKKQHSFNSIIKPVSILIAVRNEEKNIHFLLYQLLNQSYSLFEIVIVDDHSTDETINKLKKITHTKLKWYQLPDGKEGKKEAIKYGLTKCTYAWVIMTDADVKMQNDWLSSNISKMSEEAIIVSPVYVEVKKATYFNMFQQLDFAAMQYLTIASIIAKKPFMCSGANLAIPKTKALELYQAIDTSIPSGDDVFLLHKYIEQKGNVIANVLHSSAVSVPASYNLRNFIYQRLRWASKAKYYKNAMAIFVASIIFIIHFGLLIGMVWGAFNNTLLFIIFALIIIKLFIDLPLFISGKKIIPLHKKWLYYYPFVSLTYILYISTIAFWSFVVPVKWKNRTWKNGTKKENK
mgnify:FL=1